ncbi:uncharacterized protein QC761_106110 [Podospora bellae-mahoneyi]|uniref:Uncharacterized protein n=1 Tax=Podospora bellae-mahoneyi TaxID=2093777 RepID=A0ABR0FY18_9PEZI|nr:hypothetical protein QC761_106110 [Podospora bellae-mahoneyi]
MASSVMPALEITSPLDDEAPVTSQFSYQHHTMQPLEWHYVPADSNQGNSLIVAIWPTDTCFQGLQTMSLPNPMPTTSRPHRSRQLQESQLMTTALIHVPHCYLHVTSHTPASHHAPGLFERIGLPRSLVQGFLSTIALPSSTADVVGLNHHHHHDAAADFELVTSAVPHMDDQNDWVFSRCLLADFTGFGEEAAATLSRQGRLCCWISVVLDDRSGVWDLHFVVHKVGVCARDPNLSRTGACVRTVQ